jgi:carbamoyltransferase
MRLGISFGYHDSAVSLIDQNEIVCCLHEERFSRLKFDNSFPSKSLKYMGEKFDLQKIESITYYEKPFAKLERQLFSLINHKISDAHAFSKNVASIRKLFNLSPTKLLKMTEFAIGYKFDKKPRIEYSNHHLSHAASAFFTSQYEKALVFVLDAVGEKNSTSIWIGDGNDLKQISNEIYPNSYGLFYSALTSFTGFKVNTGEFKFMGLSPYGRPIYSDKIENIAFLDDKKQLTLDLNYFLPFGSRKLYSKKLSEVFPKGERREEEPITSYHADIAMSTQFVLEKHVIELIKKWILKTGINQIVMSGGVALNCVMNSKISEIVGSENFYSFSASGDAGGSLGAAFVSEYQSKNPDRPFRYSHKSSILGAEFSQTEIISVLDKFNVKYSLLGEEEVIEIIAKEISGGKIVGLFDGKEEFGPRALGNRSIIADPRIKDGQIVINEKIKFRESFRPFAPIGLWPDVCEFFEIHSEEPFMMRTSKVRNYSSQFEKPRPDNLQYNKPIKIAEYLSEVKSPLPSITHLDGSARLQTIHQSDDRKIAQILVKFKELTGIPVLINTSFNVRGEPIVNSPWDALNCFATTGLDLLLIGNILVRKTDQGPKFQSRFEKKVAND